jgi:hypothetical protein
VFSPGYLIDGEEMQGHMECCHDSRLLLDVENGGYSVETISEEAPSLIRVNSLLYAASYSYIPVMFSQ